MLNSDSELIICQHTQFYYSSGMLHPVTSGLKNEKLQLIVFDASQEGQVLDFRLGYRVRLGKAMTLALVLTLKRAF